MTTKEFNIQYALGTLNISKLSDKNLNNLLETSSPITLPLWDSLFQEYDRRRHERLSILFEGRF